MQIDHEECRRLAVSCRRKTKCFTESKFLLLGIDRDRNTGAYRALLAKAEERELTYAGDALLGLRVEEREELQRSWSLLLRKSHQFLG